MKTINYNFMQTLEILFNHYNIFLWATIKSKKIQFLRFFKLITL